MESDALLKVFFPCFW